MPALSTDYLPASLASLLSEAQLNALVEAPRDKRLAIVAAALHLSEPATLTAVAAAAGMDIASNLEADPDARSLLPARLVHDYQIIPIKRSEIADITPAPLHLATAWLPDGVMEDWLRTFTPRPPVWHMAVPERVH